MRILIAVHHFPPNHSGGAELLAQREAQRLQELGHEVEVVCLEPVAGERFGGLDAREERVDGVLVRRLWLDFQVTDELLRASYAHPLIEQYFDELLARRPFDLIHLISGYLMGLSPIRAAERRGTAVVISLLDFWFLCPTIQLLRGDGSLCNGPAPLDCIRCLADEKRRYRWIDRRAPWLLRRYFALRAQLPGGSRVQEILATLEARPTHLVAALNSVAALVVPSGFVRKVYLSHGVRRELLSIVRPGFSHGSAPGRAPAQPSSEQRPFRIGYLGQIISAKGVDLLVRAFRLLRQDAAVELHIHGDLATSPYYTDRLRRLASQAPGVHFHGRYRHEELAAVLEPIDLLVVPSRWYEGSPYVILEAFAHRKPIIATRLGALPELVRDEVDGLLFARDNVADLARQMQRVVDDPALHQQLQAQIRPVRSSEDELRELLALFERVVAQQAITQTERR